MPTPCWPSDGWWPASVGREASAASHGKARTHPPDDVVGADPARQPLGTADLFVALRQRLFGAGGRAGLLLVIDGTWASRPRRRSPPEDRRHRRVRSRAVPRPAASRSAPNASTSPTSTIAAWSSRIWPVAAARHPRSRRPRSARGTRRARRRTARGRQDWPSEPTTAPAVSNRSGNTPTRKSRAAASSAAETGALTDTAQLRDHLEDGGDGHFCVDRSPCREGTRAPAHVEAGARRRRCSPSPHGASCSAAS